jgi:hypothetical protein
MKARLDAQMFLQSLRETERLSHPRYLQFAERLLLDLVIHTMTSVFWRERLKPLIESDGGLSLANWADVPPLSMAEAEAAGAALAAEGEKPLRAVDMGEAAGPFRRRDETARIADLCMFERILEIAGIPLNARLIDLLDLPAFIFDDWAWNSTFDKAPRDTFPTHWPGDLHLEMMRTARTRGERVLRATPRTLAGLLAALDRHGGPLPKFIGIIAMGEPLDETLHASLADRFAAKVAAIWYDPRLGVVAFSDSPGNGWRLAVGTQFVEVIDENGRLCAPTLPGRIAVTTLYAYATPAIRFLPGQGGTWAIGADGRLRLGSISS